MPASLPDESVRRPANWRVPSLGTLSLMALGAVLAVLLLAFVLPWWRKLTLMRELDRRNVRHLVRTQSELPAWLENRMPFDWSEGFTNITEIDADDSFDDQTLLRLGHQPGMDRLALHSPHVTDAGMTALRGFPNLHYLEVSVPSISDAGLVPLKGLPYLTFLSIEAPELTDDGLQTLASLRWLEELRLSSPRITSKGMEHLQGLTQLKWLYLKGTGVTDDGLESLSG